MLLLPLVLLATAHSATLPGHAASFGHSSSMMPTIQNLDAKCGRSGMTVQVFFDQPFPGVIYSKGHYGDPKCHYVSEGKAGSTNYTFLVPVDGCGTHGQLEEAKPGRDMYFENTIIIQLDPLITEVWDEARLLKCVWPHTMLRRVKASPFEVYQPERVTVELDQRSINTLMEIQKGPGPFDSPATGYVYMGDDTSVVIYVQDPDKSVDANVVNCRATGLGGESVQLFDDFGCLLRPDLITQFDKSRETNGVKADLMLYSYLKAFRIGESPQFTIKCQLQVCRGKCSAPCSTGPVLARRRRRSARFPVISNSSRPEAAILKTFEVFDDEEEKNEKDGTTGTRVDLEQAVLVVEREEIVPEEQWCSLTPMSVVVAGLVLLAIVVGLSLLSCFLALRLARVSGKEMQ